jgi:hypothetical protein
MGLIIKNESEYDSIRGALGIDKDVKRQLTDEVIDELMFLPMAEAESISRVAANNFVLLMQLPPNDFSLLSFKAATAALTCSNLCPRLQVTIPEIQKIDDLGEIQRSKIDWMSKKELYRADANYFFSNVSTTYLPTAFPVALSIARGRVLAHDPDFQRDYAGQIVSNFTGFTSINGMQYQFSLV